MKIGIGMPNPVRGTPGQALVDWARRAEERGFSGLATIDRIAYPSYDSLTTLAVAAGATSRIGLVPNILLAPVYPAVLLAKSAASLDQLSGGRLTLGLATGGREDDFTAVGVDFAARGRVFDESLALMHQIWAGEPSFAPGPIAGRVPILIGGGSKAAIRRGVTWAAGWTLGGAPAEYAGAYFAQVRDAWRQAGRDGEPRLAALVYFSVGDDAEDASRAYLRDYYGFIGPYADQVAESALRTPEAIRGAVAAFTDAGSTELYFDPTTSSVDQVDRLADLVL